MIASIPSIRIDHLDEISKLNRWQSKDERLCSLLIRGLHMYSNGASIHGNAKEEEEESK